MRKAILLTTILTVGSLFAFAQSKTLTPAATPTLSSAPATTAQVTEVENKINTSMKIDQEVYDFGSIPQGIPAEAEFTITNTGKEPLIIQNVKAQCGCTTPYYTKEPIEPGKSGKVKAAYNAANPGAFNKSVTVTTNGGTSTLRIKGTVEKAAESSVPENTSMMKKS